jgi:formate--tetrahydrofolate ligase
LPLANNLLAALIDNHIHQGNEAGFDVRRVTWRRVVDVNDRSLRDITIGLGGTANGYPRQDGFDIVVASEVMAIFCLATSIKDLKDRLGKIVVGYSRDQKPILARDIKAHGAMTHCCATRWRRTWCRRWRTTRHSSMAVRSPTSRMAATR